MSASTFNFIGQHVEIVNGDAALSLDRFGQEIELDEAVADRLILGGAQILPAAIFEAQQFTAEELRQYPSTVAHDDAPESFKAKKKSALIALHDYREGLRANI